MSENKPLTRQQWYVLIAAFLGWMFDGLEMGLFPLAARPAVRDLMKTVTESGVTQYPAEAIVGDWSGWLMTCFLLGAAAGGLLFGWLGDRLGRVRTMALSIAVYAVFTGLCCFATAPWHLGVLRFCAAVGMGGEWALGVALVMECWPEKFRPILAGVIGAAANFGFLAISLIAVLFIVDEETWRWIMVVGAAPAVLAVLVLVMIPESERWKESVKASKSKPIREVFGTRLLRPTLLGICFAGVPLIATWGAVSGFLPIWTDQLAGGERTLEVTVSVLESAGDRVTLRTLESAEYLKVSDDGAADSPQGHPVDDVAAPRYEAKRTHNLEKTPSPGKEFKYRVTVTNRGRRAGTGVTVGDRLQIDIFDASSIKLKAPEATDVSFDAATGELVWTIGELEHKDPHAKGWIQTVLSIGAILGCFIGALLANWLGRRPAYFVLCLTSLISCAYLFNCLSQYNAQFIAVAAVAGLTSAAFYGWLPLYLPELFPTRVRATGQGVAFNFARILAAGGAQLTAVLIIAFDGSYPKACAIIVLIYLVGMVLIWFAPETKGKPLPE
ncbi:MAG TPA: MFS transporter [Thermoguttaceae bacterium]|nr:MFS transporter [Thermoguttaceae bacterium]